MSAACAEAAAAYIADAAEVACDYTEVVAEAVTAMHAKWAAMALRPHSAAAAVIEAMATMPAADLEYLCRTTGRSPNAVRRALRRLASADVVAVTHDDHTGRRVFEIPELLEIVDHRQSLLTRCWQTHQDDSRQHRSRPSAKELLAQWHHNVANPSP